jgi:hypothetical protein
MLCMVYLYFTLFRNEFLSFMQKKQRKKSARNPAKLLYQCKHVNLICFQVVFLFLACGSSEVQKLLRVSEGSLRLRSSNTIYLLPHTRA